MSIFLVALLVVCALEPPSRASVIDTQVEDDPSVDDGYAQFRFWTPDKRSADKAIVLTWGANQSSLGAIEDPGWQKLASELHCALLACRFVRTGSNLAWDNASGGSGGSLLEALGRFSREIHNEQLAKAKLYLVGNSQGGQFSYSFAAWKPDRVLGFVSLKGGYHDLDSVPSASTVPALFVLGELDAPFRIANIKQVVALGRAIKAPWFLATDPKAHHEPASCAPLVRSFLRAISRRQNPASKTEVGASGDVSALRWPDATFGKDLALFESGHLPRVPQELSFNSAITPPLGISSSTVLDFGIVDAGKQSGAKPLDIQSQGTPTWDEVRVLGRPYLESVNARRQGSTVSLYLRFDSGDLPIGSFSRAIPIRFFSRGEEILGGLSVPFSATVIGDVAAKPSFLYVEPSLQREVVLMIDVESKTRFPVKLESCDAPTGISVLAIEETAGHLHLKVRFRGTAGHLDTKSGNLILHLHSNRDWVVQVPYFSS